MSFFLKRNPWIYTVQFRIFSANTECLIQRPKRNFLDSLLTENPRDYIENKFSVKHGDSFIP